MPIRIHHLASVVVISFVKMLKASNYQVAINWCICKGTIPIPGVKYVKQVEENLGALGWRLSSDELLELEYAALESPQRMIQNIFQTRWVCYLTFTMHKYFPLPLLPTPKATWYNPNPKTFLETLNFGYYSKWQIIWRRELSGDKYYCK